MSSTWARLQVGEPMERALVVGLAITGRAVVDAFLRRGTAVVAVDDRPSEAAILAALDRGVDLINNPDDRQLRELVGDVDLVVPSPGVPRHHAVYSIADRLGVPIVSELDLAAIWDDRPCVAITGTNGKTTVATLVTAMLSRSGVGVAAAGNLDIPLVEAIDRENDPPVEWFVVEASSFRLERVTRFAPCVGAWLNLAPDHLDWHSDLQAYAEAKARIWTNHSDSDIKVIPAGDAVIGGHAAAAGGRTITFGLEEGDVRISGGSLVASRDLLGQAVTGEAAPIVDVAMLARRLPHDLRNAAAATACALSVGVDVEDVREELIRFSGLPHRMALVATVGGVEFYDDSKATTPEATVAAVQGFEAAVLIAGGRNKGLDLSALADAAPHLAGVVAIGEAGEIIESVFAGKVPVIAASSMEAAVTSAIELSRGGDAVLLSPACASFDWYRNYAERGDDFAKIVHQRSSESDQ